MAKKKNRAWNLGLHTMEEQSAALQMALHAMEEARSNLTIGNMDGVWYARGYLAALRDLARNEGATGLARNLDDLLEDEFWQYGIRNA